MELIQRPVATFFEMCKLCQIQASAYPNRALVTLTVDGVHCTVSETRTYYPSSICALTKRKSQVRLTNFASQSDETSSISSWRVRSSNLPKGRWLQVEKPAGKLALGDLGYRGEPVKIRIRNPRV